MRRRPRDNGNKLKLILGIPLLLSVPLLLPAQDPFEIQVYEYELVPPGMWNLETHLNYTVRGTTVPEGPVAPSSRQLHLTYELTRGFTDYFEMAGYLLLSHRPGGPSPGEIAGWRLRPRVAVPKSWKWPVDVSISLEVGFPRRVYEENSMTFELRPIVEKTVGRWQFDVNPTFTHTLRGPGTSAGWEFEPAVRAAYKWLKRFEPSVEYYGGTGPLLDPFPRSRQAHLFYPGGDIQITEHLVWNFGVGIAVTPAGDQLVSKMRLGWLFGKRKESGAPLARPGS